MFFRHLIERAHLWLHKNSLPVFVRIHDIAPTAITGSSVVLGFLLRSDQVLHNIGRVLA